MPDNATRVTDWLKRSRGLFFCHKCVSEGTGVTPQAQAPHP